MKLLKEEKKGDKREKEERLKLYIVRMLLHCRMLFSCVV